MANPGSHTTGDLTAGAIVNMDTAIYLYTPDDVPLAAGINANGGPILQSSPVDQIEFKWMDEEHLYPQSNTTGALVTATTTVPVTTGHGVRFKANDLISISGSTAGSADTELMLVTAVSTDNLTVTRDYDSALATDGSFPSGSVVRNLGQILDEGSAPGAAASKDRVLRSNYTRIYGPEKVDMSRTTQKVPRYGVPSEFAHQLRMTTLRMLQQREQDFLYGHKFQSSAKRLSGGLVQYITTLQDVSGALTVAQIETGQQTSYDAGGMWDILITNPATLSTLNDTSDVDRVRQEVVDPIRGRIPVMSVLTEFGETQVVRNRFCDATNAFGVFSSGLTRRVLDPLQMHRLAKTGDSDQVMLVMEEGLEVKGADHMIHFTGLT